jgi:hypothetical protein
LLNEAPLEEDPGDLPFRSEILKFNHAVAGNAKEGSMKTRNLV